MYSHKNKKVRNQLLARANAAHIITIIFRYYLENIFYDSNN